MSSRALGRPFVRWLHLAVGLLSIAAPQFVVNWILFAGPWARLLARSYPSLYVPLLASAHFYLVPVSVFCLATAYGLQFGRPWARWVSCTASCLLLEGFPVFTFLGIFALYGLYTIPGPKKPRKPRKVRPAASAPPRHDQLYKAQPFLDGITCFVAFQTFATLCFHAQHAGLPIWNPGWLGWLCMALSLVAYTALHEFGHAGMAWTLFFRVTGVALGPLRFFNDGGACRCRFDSNHWRDQAGYVRAVPTSGDHLRLKLIAINAAGPAMSLTAGLLWLLAFFALPGSGWERWWWAVAANAVLGLWEAVVNLVPLGGSDGAILYHLIRGTPKADRLLRAASGSMLWEQAALRHGEADLEAEIEIRRAMLDLASEDLDTAPLAAARAHLALGYALLECGDWAGAEGVLRNALEVHQRATDSAVEIAAWAGLQRAALGRRHFAAVPACAGACLEAIERNRARMASSPIRLIQAQVHLWSGDFATALGEAREAAALPGKGPVWGGMRATALSLQAQAHLALHEVEEGLAAAVEAAAILRASEPRSQRNLALFELSELGEALWKWGEAGAAIDLLREAVTGLERGGATSAAAHARIKLAAALRGLGRHSDAVYTLPEEMSLPAHLRCSLLVERGELYLAAGRAADAVTEFRQLVTAWQAEPDSPSIETAAAEGWLARALLEDGEMVEAAAVARQACDVLATAGHPDGASCRITLALAERERSRAVFDAAVAEIESAALLERGEKARRVEFERARIERYGPVEGSAVWETAAFAD